MTATTWYEAALVYLRALDIPLDVAPGYESVSRYPCRAATDEALTEWNRALVTWLAERRAAREVGG